MVYGIIKLSCHFGILFGVFFPCPISVPAAIESTLLFRVSKNECEKPTADLEYHMDMH